MNVVGKLMLEIYNAGNLRMWEELEPLNDFCIISETQCQNFQ